MLATVNTALPQGEQPGADSLDHIPAYLADSVDALLSALDESVKLRVRDIPSIQ
jgi:hypothetical protein